MNSGQARHNQRGDTLIEVILAFSVFALAAVGAMAIMNQTAAQAEDSLELGLVRRQINDQVEILRFLHVSYMADPQSTSGPGATFRYLIDHYSSTTQASTFGDPSCADTIPRAGATFALNEHQLADGSPAAGVLTGAALEPARAATAPPFAQLDQDAGVSYGIWIEGVRSPAAQTPAFVDFQVRACWDTPGSSSAPHTLGTIARFFYV